MVWAAPKVKVPRWFLVWASFFSRHPEDRQWGMTAERGCISQDPRWPSLAGRGLTFNPSFCNLPLLVLPARPHQLPSGSPLEPTNRMIQGEGNQAHCVWRRARRYQVAGVGGFSSASALQEALLTLPRSGPAARSSDSLSYPILDPVTLPPPLGPGELFLTEKAASPVPGLQAETALLAAI